MVHENDGGRHTPPAELRALPRWALYRKREKTYKGGKRTILQPVHPVTGAEPKVSAPETWATFDEVTAPKLRKPADGVGLLVLATDGLAVVRHAERDVLRHLGERVVYAETEMDGDGLLLVVRAGVLGAKTKLFVPLNLSGQAPTPAAEPGCLDTADGLSGRPSGQQPTRNSGVSASCLDKSHSYTLNLLKNNGAESKEETPNIRRELHELASNTVEQGKTGGIDQLVYPIINIVKRHGLSRQEVTPELVVAVAEATGEEPEYVARRVRGGWGSWRAARVPLDEAVKAAGMVPSLLKLDGVTVADHATLLAVGVCRWLGQDGEPFPLPLRQLAHALGLRDHKAAEAIVGDLVEMKVITLHKKGDRQKKLASEYRLVGVEPAQAPPPPVVPAAPSSPAKRPGWSPVETPEFWYKSKHARGGYLNTEHRLAEWMTQRWLARTKGRELPAGPFWEDPEVGGWYGRQVVAARKLLQKYDVLTIAKALNTGSGKTVFSLALKDFEPLVAAEKRRAEASAVAAQVERDALAAERARFDAEARAWSAANPEPAPPAAPPKPAGQPRPFAQKTLSGKLRDL